MTTDEIVAVLRRAPLIGLFEDDALRIIANVADRRRLTDGEVLFRHGERSDGGYVVLSGAFAVLREGQDDDAEGALRLDPGALIGEVALFARLHRPATVVARDAAEVLRISPTLMKRVLQDHPAAAERMVDAMYRDVNALAAGLTSAEALFAAEA